MKSYALAAAILAAAGPAYSQGAKRDVQGVAPGMTQAQVESVVGRKCKPFGYAGASCGETNAQAILVSFTKSIQPPIAQTIRFTFCSADAPSVVFKKIVQAYSIDVTRLPRGVFDTRTETPTDNFRVALDDQTTFAYQRMGGRACFGETTAYEFEIIDNKIAAADTAEAQSAAKRSAPTPKF